MKKKYQIVIDFLLKQINQHKLTPGTKISTEHELAEMLSVSRGTVRKAIEELVKSGVLATGQGSGTYVKRTTAFEQMLKLTLIFNASANICDSFYAGILAGAVNAASSRNAAVNYITCDDVDSIVSQIHDGAILVNSRNAEVLTAMEKNHIPVSLIIPQFDVQEPHDIIESDEYAGAVIAAEKLLKAEHKKFAVIAGPQDQKSGITRLKGFYETLINNGIKPDDIFIEYGKFDASTAKQSMQKIMTRNNDFTALFAANDLMAISAMHILLHAGIRIPQDVSVIGYDGTEAGMYVYPSLTTLDIKVQQMGEWACNALLDRIKQPFKPVTCTTIKPELQLRESVLLN